MESGLRNPAADGPDAFMPAPVAADRRELRRDGKAVLGGRSALSTDSATGDLVQVSEQPGIRICAPVRNRFTSVTDTIGGSAA